MFFFYSNFIRFREYSLTSIIKVEEFAAKFNASMTQFFLDIEVINTKTGQVARIAEHVWENLGDKTLCKPGESSWDPDVMVYVIVTVKNQGFWLRHFIDTLVYIQEQTDDSNIHPIIVDFGSQDVGFNDTEIYLERCPLKHYTGNLQKDIAS